MYEFTTIELHIFEGIVYAYIIHIFSIEFMTVTKMLCIVKHHEIRFYDGHWLESKCPIIFFINIFYIRIFLAYLHSLGITECK